MIILKLVLKEEDVRLWTKFFWFRTETGSEFLRSVN